MQLSLFPEYRDTAYGRLCVDDIKSGVHLLTDDRSWTYPVHLENGTIVNLDGPCLLTVMEQTHGTQ